MSTHIGCVQCQEIKVNPHRRLNLWLAVLGVALWALAPAAVESGRLDPPLADTIFQEGISK